MRVFKSFPETPSLIQLTRRIPPNLRFRVPRDYEGLWAIGEDSCDLIHIRQACGSVQSWPELYQKVFQYVGIVLRHLREKGLRKEAELMKSKASETRLRKNRTT